MESLEYFCTFRNDSIVIIFNLLINQAHEGMSKVIIVFRFLFALLCIASCAITVYLVLNNVRSFYDAIAPLLGCMSMIWSAVHQFHVLRSGRTRQ